MTSKQPRRAMRLVRLALVALAASAALPIVPARADDGTVQEIRLRKLEAEVKALQRQVFPGGDTRFFPQDGSAPAAPPPPGTSTGTQVGTPASPAVNDLLTRMDAVESAITRLTSQNEELSHRLHLLEDAQKAQAAAAAQPAPESAPPADVAPPPPVAVTPAPRPRPAPVEAPPPPAKPTSQRVAGVKAIVKPDTGDAGEDEYTYGFKLWEAKFYPEAEQQLKMFIDKYPRHKRVSYARNLLGRAYLDDGKPREAAPWFLQNYQSDKKGPRAADSLLLLAESMVELKDTNRACIALAEFSDTYKADAAGRLKSQYDATSKAAKCN